MTTKSLTLLFVAGTCGLVASYIITKSITKTQSASAASPQSVSVVVAAVELKIGDKLKQEHLELKQFSSGEEPDGVFSNKEQIIGKTLKMKVFCGEPIIEAKLGLTNRLDIRPGYRAATVALNDTESRLGDILKPGDFVDVNWLYTDPETGEASIKELIQNVRILAVGQTVVAADSESMRNRGEGKGESAYTLEVTKEQYQLLSLASTQGNIRLSLRGQNDDSEGGLDRAYTMGDLLGKEPKVEPVEREPAPIWKLQFISGKGIHTESFPQP